MSKRARDTQAPLIPRLSAIPDLLRSLQDASVKKTLDSEIQALKINRTVFFKYEKSEETYERFPPIMVGQDLGDILVCYEHRGTTYLVDRVDPNVVLKAAKGKRGSKYRSAGFTHDLTPFTDEERKKLKGLELSGDGKHVYSSYLTGTDIFHYVQDISTPSYKTPERIDFVWVPSKRKRTFWTSNKLNNRSLWLKIAALPGCHLYRPELLKCIVDGDLAYTSCFSKSASKVDRGVLLCDAISKVNELASETTRMLTERAYPILPAGGSEPPKKRVRLSNK